MPYLHPPQFLIASPAAMTRNMDRKEGDSVNCNQDIIGNIHITVACVVTEMSMRKGIK